MYKDLLSFLFIGIVIKIMDDYLDQELDKLTEQWNICNTLGRGVLPYSLVFMVLALYFNLSEGLSFFWASYSLGMTSNLKEKLPSKLLAWQESLLAFIISITLSSFFTTISSFILIFLIQIIDDYIDYSSDVLPQQTNLIFNLGRINCLVITLILLLLAIHFFFFKLICFTLAGIIIYFSFAYLKYFTSNF